MASTLLIGSCEPFSGKSAVVLGLARLLGRQGVKVLFGKPLATTLQNPADAPGASGGAVIDADVRFVGQTLGLADSQLIPSLQVLAPETARARLLASDIGPGPGFEALR